MKGLRELDAAQRRVARRLSARRLLLATRSAGKLRELRAALRGARPRGDRRSARRASTEIAEEDALEAFATFEENALAKARYFHARQRACRRSPTIPGSRSTRSAARRVCGASAGAGARISTGQALDDENNRLLLERLRGAADRGARYVCAAAYVDGERELVRRGETRGRIVDAPRGASGFGYDPYFLVG